jgi:hypothetical protein
MRQILFLASHFFFGSWRAAGADEARVYQTNSFSLLIARQNSYLDCPLHTYTVAAAPDLN